MSNPSRLPPYRQSLAGTLLAAREAVMAPLRPLLRDADLTDQQWRVLRVLADAGPLDASAIAVQALLSPPSLTRISRELQERGLIERSIDASDRRRSVIRITAAGAARVEETARHTAALLADYAAAFGPQRMQQLIADMAELAQVLARFAPAGEDDGPGD